MNSDVWNTKDMFSTTISMGLNKPSSWISAPGDCNNMSDSQFLFGSQFCPENSQSTSAPLELNAQARQGKSSQQNSQESEPSVFAKYQSKPQLFGGDRKERGLLNFPAGRFKGAFEQFNEHKKKIKDKHDSDILNTFILNNKESLQKLQSSLDKFDETLKSILDAFGNLSETMQEKFQTHYGLLLNTLRDKNETEQTLLGMENRLKEKDSEISDLKSSLQLLKDSLEQQTDQHLKLCEQLSHLQIPSLLTELQRLISACRGSSCMKSSAAQTSPGMSLKQPPAYSHLNTFKAPCESKPVSPITSSQDKENVNIQQRPPSQARGHNANKPFCPSYPCTTVPAGSQEGGCLLMPEPWQSTPVRKVINRSTRAREVSTKWYSQVNRIHVDKAIMQNHAGPGCKEEMLTTDSKLQSQGVGSRMTGTRGKRKCKQKKSLCSIRKEETCSKGMSASFQQKMSTDGCYKLQLRSTMDLDNSSLGSLIISQKKMCQTQKTKAGKFKLVFQSRENMQHVSAEQEMSEVKERMNHSNVKNCNNFWTSYSEESSVSPDQLRWFNLFDNNSSICTTPVQQKSVTYCPLLFDSDYSD